MAKNPKKAILIDGNSLAYRAFYALPDTMKTSSGTTVNAVYGFTTMLMKILEKKPDLIAIAFDKAAPTFRHKEYAGYKATRQKAPPTLYEQMPLVKKMSEAFNIPALELEGYEADDIIGTLAKKAEKAGYDVEIFTGDMDALQLIDENISVMRTMKGITDIVRFDRKEVESKYGISPEQVVDYKAILGDTSDNIPGIHGIGKVGAVNLLREFGSLDAVLENASRIKSPSLRKKVQEGLASAKLSRKLATIVTDAPVKMDIGESGYKGMDWDRIIPAFEEFEFNSLIKKYGGKKSGAAAQEKREMVLSKDARYVTVDTVPGLEELAAVLKSSPAFAFDTETTGVDPFSDDIVGISLCAKAGEAYYIPVGHKSGKQLDLKTVVNCLLPVFEDGAIKKYAQNAKFDAEILYRCGISVRGIAFDTMIAAYTLDPTSGKYGLKSLAHGLLGRNMMDITDLIGTGAKQITMADVDINKACVYACSDADMTFQLVGPLKDSMEKEGLSDLFNKIEVPLVDVLIAMEENGISIDREKMHRMSGDIENEIKKLETQIFAISGETYNINSSKQLQSILYDKLKLPVIKRTKTGASTDAEVLEELADTFEIAAKLMEYRQLQKFRSTYVDVLPELVNPETGRIHSSFNQTVTATGRLSSTNPNLQNIPAKGDLAQEIREAFVPAKKGWKIISADYSQIELRILAHLSGDPVFTKAFLEDMDIHRATAAEVFDVSPKDVTDEMRSKAKVVNFGIIYGMSDFGLSKSLRIKRAEAAKYIETYFRKHAGIKKFIDQVIDQARKDGFVCTLLGRKRPIPDINNPNNSLRQFAERVAINTPVQGTAADIIKVAMINIHELLKKKDMKSMMILQIHDELVFESPEDEAAELIRMINNEMVNAVKLSVPVRVHIGAGNNWAEAKT